MRTSFPTSFAREVKRIDDVGNPEADSTVSRAGRGVTHGVRRGRGPATILAVAGRFDPGVQSVRAHSEATREPVRKGEKDRAERIRPVGSSMDAFPYGLTRTYFCRFRGRGSPP